MDATNQPAQISLDTLHSLTLRYNTQVPDKVKGLEELRIKTIPEALTQRKKDCAPLLEKSEVTSLVEWKLKHGTYRPNLAKLVGSNSVKDVRDTTRNAFEVYEADKEAYDESITILSKLKGIGPATSSLLLSCYDPVKIPFFSDELYRYLHWEGAKSKGWDRKINYTMKEYKSLFEKVTELRERLEHESSKQISTIDIEKAAYVLGRNALSSSKSSPFDTEAATDDKEPQPPPPKRQRKARQNPKK